METNFHRLPRLLLGVLSLLFAGIIYAWSILKAPLAAEFGWTAAQLAVNFTFTMCFFCLGGLFSGLLSKKTTPRLRLLLAAVLVFVGFFITSRLNGEHIFLLYLAYGVLAGTGIGLIYNTTLAVTGTWYPDKKGFCTGALMMGFGFSTLLLGKLAGKLIDAPACGWRTTFLLLGIAVGLVALVEALLIKAAPPEISALAPQRQAAAPAAADLTAGQMLRRGSLWLLFLSFICFAAVGNTSISFAKDFAMSLGVAANAAVTMVGVLAVCNGGGRLLSGALFDAWGMRKTQYATALLAVVAAGLSLLAVVSGWAWLGIISLCLCGVSYGFLPTVGAALTGSLYGQKNFALNYGIFNLHLIPASVTASVAGGLITGSGSYISTFILLTVLAVVGLVVNLSVKKA